jgi:hypothetical protein
MEMTVSMWAWVVAAPIGFFGLLMILGWLEETIVQPDHRAATITGLLERAHTADEIEDAVSRLLAAVAPRRRAS